MSLSDRRPPELDTLAQHAADAEKRAKEARTKAGQQHRLEVRDWWLREAARLDDLARRERERFEAARLAHESAQAHPEPF